MVVVVVVVVVGGWGGGGGERVDESKIRATNQSKHKTKTFTKHQTRHIHKTRRRAGGFWLSGGGQFMIHVPTEVSDQALPSIRTGGKLSEGKIRNCGS